MMPLCFGFACRGTMTFISAASDNCGNEYVFGIFNPTPHNDSSYGLIPTENDDFPPRKFDGTVIDSPTGTQGNSGASKGFYDQTSGRYMHWTWIW